MQPTGYKRLLHVLIFFLLSAVKATAADGQPVKKMEFTASGGIFSADTIPAPEKAVAAVPAVSVDKPVESVIKEVPKARKQTAPVPVTIRVVPVQVVKPKIIKPAIKVRIN